MPFSRSAAEKGAIVRERNLGSKSFMSELEDDFQHTAARRQPNFSVRESGSVLFMTLTGVCPLWR